MNYRLSISLALFAFLTPPAWGASQVVTQEATATEKPLPDARTIIDHYLELTGDAKVLTSTSSMRVKGKIEVVGTEFGGPMEVLVHSSNRRLIHVEMTGIGSIREGFDGTTAWSIQPLEGPRIREGAERLQTILQANYTGALVSPEDFEHVQTLARTEFEGRECWKIELIARTPPGVDAKATLKARTSHQYYDVETGLLAGTEFTAIAGAEEHKAVAIASDYEKLGERLVAMTTVQKARGQTIKLTTESITYDDVQPAAFGLPDEISRELARVQEAANMGR